MEEHIKMKKPNNFITKKGQALTEFAIFGSILLFCVAMLVQYGLQSNYQQEAQMETFRKAQKLAFYREGPNAASSLVSIKYKNFPDPRDQFGFAERSAVSSGDSVVWNTDQSAQYVKKFADRPKEEDLPVSFFEIEKAHRPAEAASATGATLPAKAKLDNAFAFYTARFERAPCPDVLTVVLEDRTHNDSRNANKTEYFPVKVYKSQIYVGRIEGGFSEKGETEMTTESELLMYPFFRADPDSVLKQRITDADLDGDGKLESIIGADKSKNLLYVRNHDTPSKEYSNLQDAVGEIQIDTTYLQIEPEDKDAAGNALGLERRQGMIPDYEKATKYTENKIVKTETPDTLTSKTTLDSKQTVVQKFRLNNGQIVNIPVEFSTDKNKTLYDWSKK